MFYSEIMCCQHLEKSHETKECLVLLLKKKVVKIMFMTHLMFEINLLLGCEAACWSVVCCFEWRNSKFWIYKCIFFLI